MTRRLEPRAAGGEGDRGEAVRLRARPRRRSRSPWRSTPPISSRRRIPSRWRTGVSPTLAALEMMLYPKSALVIANTILSAIGTVEILPAEGPMLLFVWGPTRVLPVRLSSLSITEEAYDTLLNPTRAKAEISLTVLSYHDLNVTTPGMRCSWCTRWPRRSWPRPISSTAPRTSAWRCGSRGRAMLFPANSRYHSTETTTLETPDGRVIVYLRRRFVPPPERFTMLQEHVVPRATASTTSPRATWVIRSSSGACATPIGPCARRSSPKRSADACASPSRRHPRSGPCLIRPTSR